MKAILAILLVVALAIPVQACGLLGRLMGGGRGQQQAQSYSAPANVQFSGCARGAMQQQSAMYQAAPMVREQIIVQQPTRRRMESGDTESRIDELLDEIQSLKDQISRKVQPSKHGDDLRFQKMTTRTAATVPRPPGRSSLRAVSTSSPTAPARVNRFRISQARLERRAQR